jgi:hypothetical protein
MPETHDSRAFSVPIKPEGGSVFCFFGIVRVGRYPRPASTAGSFHRIRLLRFRFGRFRSRPASGNEDTRPPHQLADEAGREDIPWTASQPFAISSRFQLTYPMTDEDERELQSELARLQQEHRDLDAAIDALHQSPAPDLLRLQRLKKRKLQLRDRIAFIEDQITPDIIA